MANRYIDRLLQDPHIIGLEKDYWKPLIVDSSLFGERRDWVEKYVIDLQKFLAMPYIIDNFAHHGLRSKWKHIEVLEKYGQEAVDFLQENALRSQKFMIAYHCTTVMNPDNYVGKNPEEFGRRISKLIETYSELEKDLSDTAPIDKVKELKKKAYAVLEFLSGQNAQSLTKEG